MPACDQQLDHGRSCQYEALWPTAKGPRCWQHRPASADRDPWAAAVAERRRRERWRYPSELLEEGSTWAWDYIDSRKTELSPEERELLARLAGVASHGDGDDEDGG